jgi:preprotein translocase subunit SecG
MLIEGALQIASIIISVLLTILILLQVRGGSMGKLLSGEGGGGIARTRRGLERTLFQFTIALSVAFIAISILSVAFTGQ